MTRWRDRILSAASYWELAEKELAGKGAEASVDRQWDPVRDAVQRARQLRAEGQREEADLILSGLKTLYHGDPAAEAVLEGKD